MVGKTSTVVCIWASVFAVYARGPSDSSQIAYVVAANPFVKPIQGRFVPGHPLPAQLNDGPIPSHSMLRLHVTVLGTIRHRLGAVLVAVPSGRPARAR